MVSVYDTTFSPLRIVRGAPDALAASVQDMGVNHGGLHVLVAEQFLQRPDVVVAFQKLHAKRRAQSMAAGAFGYSGCCDRLPKRLLNPRFVDGTGLPHYSQGYFMASSALLPSSKWLSATPTDSSPIAVDFTVLTQPTKRLHKLYAALFMIIKIVNLFRSRLCQQAVDQGVAPFAPHLLYQKMEVCPAEELPVIPYIIIARTQRYWVYASHGTYSKSHSARNGAS